MARLIGTEPLGRSRRRYYSLRNAIIGSTLEARRAGIAQANPDTKPSRIAPAKRMTGSRGFACAHFGYDLAQGERKSDTCEDSGAQASQCRPKTHSQQVSALRAQRHTNPEFSGALCHCVGHHAVQPYSGESQGEPGKNAKDPRCEMLLLPLGFISEASFEIISATDLIRVNGPQLLAHRMSTA